MQVMVGPAFTIDVPSSPSSPPHVTPEYDEEGYRPMIDDGAGEREASTSGFRVGGHSPFFVGDLSESSSSIGTPDDSDDNSSQNEEDEDEEVESKLKGLASLDSLEDSLPIKRGLSSHFAGKSKSFTDLSQVSNVKEIPKQENPFNKRRRVQIASKWSRRSSFYAYSNPKSMPLLPLVEDPESEEEENYKEDQDEAHALAPSSSSAEERKNQRAMPQSYAEHMRLRLGSFKSRSLSLADLQEHDEEEEEEEDDYDDDD